MNENELPLPLTDEEIAEFSRRGRQAGLSDNYRATDDELKALCRAANVVLVKQGLDGELGLLNMENTRYRKGYGRKIIRQLQPRIKFKDDFDAEVDRKYVIPLIIQAFNHERTETVFKMCMNRLNEWEDKSNA